jgi:hypothetical protein
MTVPTLTTPPTAPSRNDAPATFITRANAFIAYFATLVSQLLTAITWFDTTAAQVALDRTATTASETAASTSAVASAAQVPLATAQAVLAQGYASSALNAPGTSATSSTGRSLTAGSKAFTLDQTGKLFSIGQTVVVTRTSDPTKRMVGPITAFAADVLTVDVQLLSSTGGPYSDWTIALSAPPLSSVASQAEAEAGTANDREMTPLRVAQAIQALGKPYTVIASVSPTGGATSVAFTAIPTTYEDLLIEIEDVTMVGGALTIALGNITPSYSAAMAITGSGGEHSGAILLPAAKRDYGAAIPAVGTGAMASPGALASTLTTPGFGWHVAGGIRAIAVAVSASQFSGAGAIRLLGR